MPFLKCRSVAKIHDEECKKLTKQLLDVARKEQMLGQPMMYDLVEFAKRVASFKNERERKRRGDRGNGGEAVGDGSGGAVSDHRGSRTRYEGYERWAKAFDAERALGKWTTETNNNNDKIDDALPPPPPLLLLLPRRRRTRNKAVSCPGEDSSRKYEALRKSGSLENEEGQEEDDEDEEKNSEDMSNIIGGGYRRKKATAARKNS